MNRKIVDVAFEVFKHRPVSIRSSRCQVAKLEDPAAISLIFGSVHFISFAASSADITVVVGAAMAHLPWSVHLIPQPPVVDFPRFRRPFCFRSRVIAVSAEESQHTPPIAGLHSHVPVPEIHGDVRFGFQRVGILQELVGAESLFRRFPAPFRVDGGRWSRGPIPSFQ